MADVASSSGGKCACAAPPQNSRRFLKAVQLAFPQRHAIGIIVLLTLLTAEISAVEPLIVKSIFDVLSGAHRYDTLFLLIGTLAAFAVSREAMDGLSNWLTWRTRIGLQYALLEAVVGKLHKMPLRMQRSEGVGAIMTRLDRSIQGFTNAVSVILFNVLPSLIFLSIAIGIMLTLDWRLALTVFIFAPMPALIAMRAGPEQVQRERVLLDRWAHIYSRFNEVLSGILVVRSFAMEDTEKARFLNDVSSANKVVIRGVAMDSRHAAVSNLAIAIAKLSTIGLGSYLVVQDEITIGTVIAF
jgi:ATP-binding cassette subfamily B protein